MITFLEYLINHKFKCDLELLYGVGSKVMINSFKYSTNDKIFEKKYPEYVENMYE